MTTVGIFTATAREFLHIRPRVKIQERAQTGALQYDTAHYGNTKIFFIRTGIGPSNARQAADLAFKRFPLHAAVITGYACALKPASVGDLIIGEDVFRLNDMPPHQITLDPTLLSCAQQSQQRTALPFLRGTVVTTDTIAWNVREKRHIAATSQATGLDMESSELASAAAVHEIPCVIVRAVSDLLDEDLPIDLNLFRSPLGTLRGLSGIVRHPSHLRSLYRLKRQTELASSQLSLFLSDFLPTLSSFTSVKEHSLCAGG